MHWAALLTSAESSSSPSIDAAGVSVWALQFTPRVALLGPAVLIEVEQSLRLFHGEEKVHELVETGAAQLGVTS